MDYCRCNFTRYCRCYVASTLKSLVTCRM